jgi:myo-inositol-1(or 4)-monophosphatase
MASKKTNKKPAKKAAAKKSKPVKKAPAKKSSVKGKSKSAGKPVKKAVKAVATKSSKPATKKAAAKAPAHPAAKTAAPKAEKGVPQLRPIPKLEPPKPRAATPISRPSLITPGRPANPRAKVLSREFLFEVANAVRVAVEPLVRQAKGREIVGSAQSGDTTFGLDKVAEKALLTFLREAKMPVAYYSEDAGYATFTTGQPQHLLVVDPIDGSRAAKSGFEGCVISVASTRVIERPRMIDIDNGCIMEILHPRTFYAERGKGAKIYADNTIKKPKLSKNADLEMMSWSLTVPARPAELVFPTAAKLIDLTSLKGGFFSCNSTSYSLTRLLTCQYDACVDFANRYLRDIPNIVEDASINAGRGSILGIAPYDIAASLLIAREAGCIVTDAFGNSLDDILLLDSSVANHRSLIAASNKELYEKLFSFFDTRIKQFELLLQRRAQAGGGGGQ